MLATVLTAAITLGVCAQPAAAVDLEWDNLTPGLLFYDSATNWNPVNTPDDADNVLFAADQTLTIILGAPSNANNFTVTAGDWTFTGGGGTSLDTEGVLRIDDASTLTGAAATIAGPSNWHNLGDAIIGDAGLGTFTIEAGSVVEADQVFVGNQLGGVGEVTATGAGTILRARLNSNTGVHVIGNNGGTGTVHILDGAHLRTTSTGGNDIWVGSGTDGGDLAHEQLHCYLAEIGSDVDPGHKHWLWPDVDAWPWPGY